MHKTLILAKIADARKKGDMQEVRRLQAFLPVSPLIGAALAPLLGQEVTDDLIAQVEESKRCQREASPFSLA